MFISISENSNIECTAKFEALEALLARCNILAILPTICMFSYAYLYRNSEMTGFNSMW